MFSRRTEWDLSENPLALELDRLRAGWERLLDLTESNPTQAGIAYPPELVLKPFFDLENLVYAPQPKGSLKARAAIARDYADKGVEVSPDNIILTASSSESYGFLFRLLADPNDRVLLPAPSYPLFAYLAGLNDVDVAYYNLFFDGQRWRIDFDALEEAVDRGARAVVLVNPNNPTGSCVSPEELRRLNGICAGNGVALISDEVFLDYIFDPQVTGCPSLAANTGALSFALGGLSKGLALPQMKLGWIAVNGPKKEVKAALDRLEVIADTYLSVNTPAQNAAGAWLAGSRVVRDQVLARVKANSAFLRSVIPSGARTFPVEGGWYALIQAELGSPEDVWALELLKKEHVIVHPGFFFDFAEEGVLVVSLLCQEATFQEGARRLAGAIEK